MTSSKPKLIVVDDEQDMVDYLARALRRFYTVTKTSSATRALEMVTSGGFDIIVTDHHMPEMSGIELLERAGDLQPALVRVLLSGFSNDEDIENAVRRGAIHTYLVKPVDSGSLRNAIEHACRMSADKES